MRVPFYKQETNCTCGPAALQMVFAYFGKPKSQIELSKHLKTQEHIGTKHEEMIRGAANAGFDCVAKDEASIDEIHEYISNDIPVIVNFINPATEHGHYAVIVDLTEETIVLNDPWNGEEYELPKDEFESRWHSEHEAEKGWIMVLSR